MKPNGHWPLPDGKALPDPFPQLPDYAAVKQAIAERKTPPGGKSPAEFKRWRHGALVKDSDQWVKWLGTVGAVNLPDVDPVLTDLAKGGGLVGGQCERFDFSPMGKLHGVNLDGANLRATDWTDMDVRNCRFNNADFSRANLYHARFTDCEFATAELSMAYLRGAVFENCKLTGATIRMTTAKHSLWINCDLRSSDHALTVYLGAKWYRCQLHDTRNVDTAVFYWYRHETETEWMSYTPQPGYRLVEESELGAQTVRENSGRATWQR